MILVEHEQTVFLGIRRSSQYVLQLHPLHGECIEKSLDFWISQHVVDGLVQHLRLGEFATGSKAQKFVIWTTGP